MEPASKRLRMQIGHDSRNSGHSLAVKRQNLQLQLNSRFEQIYARFEKDFTGVGDEIDLRTGKVFVDNGHLSTMRNEHDTLNKRSRKKASRNKDTMSLEDPTYSKHSVGAAQTSPNPPLNMSEDADSDSDSLLGQQLQSQAQDGNPEYQGSIPTNRRNENRSSNQHRIANDMAGSPPVDRSYHKAADRPFLKHSSPNAGLSLWDLNESEDSSDYCNGAKNKSRDVREESVLLRHRRRSESSFMRLEQSSTGHTAVAIRHSRKTPGDNGHNGLVTPGKEAIKPTGTGHLTLTDDLCPTVTSDVTSKWSAQRQKRAVQPSHVKSRPTDRTIPLDGPEGHGDVPGPSLVNFDIPVYSTYDPANDQDDTSNGECLNHVKSNKYPQDASVPTRPRGVSVSREAESPMQRFGPSHNGISQHHAQLSGLDAGLQTHTQSRPETVYSDSLETSTKSIPAVATDRSEDRTGSTLIDSNVTTVMPRLVHKYSPSTPLQKSDNGGVSSATRDVGQNNSSTRRSRAHDKKQGTGQRLNQIPITSLMPDDSDDENPLQRSVIRQSPCTGSRKKSKALALSRSCRGRESTCERAFCVFCGCK